MIYSQLPPLNSLKAFDAVVKHGSISEAARILFVSQSAISRHIVKLEEFIGSQLLHRGKHGTSPTKAGQEYYNQVTHAFNGILDATVNIRATQTGLNIIRISSLSSFALKWLVPKINLFQTMHPEIILDISIADECPNFENSQKDCAIVSRMHNLLGRDANFLFEEELIVIASPSLFKTPSSVTVEELETLPLIHTTSRSELWQAWGEQHKLFKNNNAIVGLTFQDFYISIAACVSGSGIALVPSFLVKEELEIETLIQPLKYTLKTGKSYGIVISPTKRNNHAVISLRNWLIEEIQKERNHL